MKYAILFFILLSVTALAEKQLYPVLLNQDDKPGLQRGATIYFNYCSGCHSLKYMRYNRLAKDLGIVDQNGKVLQQIVSAKLKFNDTSAKDIITTALTPGLAKRWFGVVPPDLSVMARAKGADWLYTYLKSFYRDNNRLWGTNNLVAPDVAMPDVLINLQGIQIPVYKKTEPGYPDIVKIDHLVLIEKGKLPTASFNEVLTDLVNFLVYVSDPGIYERESAGKWTLLYLAILVVLFYCSIL